MEQVELNVGDGTCMRAVVARPAKATPGPGIIIFQEAFGVNDHIKDIARRFANEGYVAVAPELFHRTAPGFQCDYSNLQAAMPHIKALTVDGILADARAAFDWLNSDEQVAKEAIFSIGFCMGGRVSFLADSAIPLKAAVSFYGAGISTYVDRAASLQGAMLFIWGGLDKHILPDQISAISQALRQHRKEFVNAEFSTADHGFFCDARPAYHPASARQAWRLTLQFLADHR